jgi:hypothetical protein
MIEQNNSAVKRVVIVGGGTAGWLVAASLAAHFDTSDDGLQVTLVESDTIGTIGVGEGTWPSMRTTLNKIGISETDFVRICGASFKQGSQFRGWRDGRGESYYHPFSLPEQFAAVNPWDWWQATNSATDYAHAVSSQTSVCEASKAPKQIEMPGYAYALNYGYHLDAGKFAEMLRAHSTERLSVKHVVDHLVGVETDADDFLIGVRGEKSGLIEGDLFIDCSGFHAFLLNGHYGIGVNTEPAKYLFNDRALAVQLPYDSEQSPIASVTLGTAHSAGWTWDIGLQHRRGVGRLYSSAHQTDEEAEAGLREYVEQSAPHVEFDQLNPRQIKFQSGFRNKFWHKNCVAIGLSAGFVEPLEASALVLVELGAKFLCDHMPVDRQVMAITARRFNEQFTYRWNEIVRFLKLHYVLSRRDDSDYWRAHRQPETNPGDLNELLALWRTRAPWHQDEGRVDDLFPSASYQYVLYGMGFETKNNGHGKRRMPNFEEVSRKRYQQEQQYLSHLPTNRELVQQLLTREFRAG